MKIELTSRDFILFLLIIVGFVFILESNTSLKTPIIFGDEGFHAGIARWMAENKEYPQWNLLGYTKVFKTNYARPPLFNLLEAGFLFLFGGQEVILKILPPLIGALIGIVFYILVKRLYSRELGLISTLILIGIPSFVTYTVLVFDEILLVLNMLIFLLSFLLAIKENRKKYWALAAIFGGLSILTKNAGIILFLFIPLALSYLIFKEKKISFYFKHLIALLIIITLISGPFFLRNLVFYNAPICYSPFGLIDINGCVEKTFEETLEFETRTLAGGTENSITRFGLLNFIDFAYGNHWFILIGAIGGFIVFLTKSSDKVNSLVLIMLIFSVYSLYVTFYRVEDAARQLLFWSALIIMIAGTYWVEIYKFLQRRQKYLGLLVIVAILFFSYKGVTAKLTVMESVKQFSPSFFEACDWAKENLPKDVVIMTFWGHRAGYNCQRTISPGWADIRLNEDPEKMVDVARVHGITHFFIQKFSITQQPSRESYSLNFVQLLENNADKFEKVFENGPPLNQCLQQGGCDGNIIYKVIY